MEKDKETKATEEREGSQVNQNVVDFGSAMTKTAHGTVYTLAIIGQIEGHTAAPNGTKTTQYEHMLPLLAKLEESREVDGILFLLNTVGGDVEAGLAIAELIAGLTKPTAAIVLGGSHSIGHTCAVDILLRVVVDAIGMIVSLVGSLHIGNAVNQVGHPGKLCDTLIEVERELGLAHLTRLGVDDDNAVTTTHTINGC